MQTLHKLCYILTRHLDNFGSSFASHCLNCKTQGFVQNVFMLEAETHKTVNTNNVTPTRRIHTELEAMGAAMQPQLMALWRDQQSEHVPQSPQNPDQHLLSGETAMCAWA